MIRAETPSSSDLEAQNNGHGRPHCHIPGQGLKPHERDRQVIRTPREIAEDELPGRVRLRGPAELRNRVAQLDRRSRDDRAARIDDRPLDSPGTSEALRAGHRRQREHG